MGSVSVTISKRTVFGNKRVIYGTLSPSTSYATGGESYVVSKFALRSLEGLFVFPVAGYVPEDDPTNKKVKIRGQEPTNATSGVIALSEVAATTNLSANKFPFLAIGY